jgi:hypothetical protein
MIIRKTAPFRLVFLAAMLLLWPAEGVATDAYLHLKNRVQPLYVQNVKMFYAGRWSGVEEAIVMRQDQLKYESYPFQRIRKIVVRGVSGFRNLHPVFQAELYLRETGHWIDVLLMPLRKISGTFSGRVWEYDMRIDYGHDDNAVNFKEIVFVYDDKEQGSSK